jgi:hypothetical protein
LRKSRLGIDAEHAANVNPQIKNPIILLITLRTPLGISGVANQQQSVHHDCWSSGTSLELYPMLRIEVSFSYRGSLAARNCDLIQPLKRSLSTCTQSPSRFVTVKRVPLGAVPRTRPFAEGANLMFTPGRCKKTMSGFCDAETGWCGALFAVGAAGATSGVSTLMEAGRSGQATATDGSGESTGLVEAA